MKRNDHHRLPPAEETEGLKLALRTVMPAVLIMLMILIAVMLGGCASSRHARDTATAAGTHTEEVSGSVLTSSSRHLADTLATQETSAVHASDSTRTLAYSTGRVEIARDTAGRPVAYSWALLDARSSAGGSESTSLSGGCRTSGTEESASAAAGRTVSLREEDFTEKSRETSEKKYGTPVECRIGWALAAFAVIYIIYTIIKDHITPWIRQRKK